MVKYLLALLLVFAVSASAYGAPVGLTSQADATKSELYPDSDLGLNIGFVADIVDERKIDIDSGEFEMTAFTVRLGVTAFERLNFYADFGQAQDMEYSYVIQGEKYNTEFDDAFMWGVGTSVLIYRWDNGIEMGANASYRRADMEVNKTTIDTAEYKRSQMSTIKDGDFVEYQAALEVAWKTEFFIPYIGVKYSDVEVDSEFTIGTAERNASGKNASENFGAFVGLTITPKLFNMPPYEQLAINLEGRFIDETAFNVELAYKF